MQTIDQYLPDHPFFAGLDAETTDLLAGCAVNVHVRAGEFLFRENDPADHFYVLRRGRVAVEVHTPARGVVLDTVNEGEIVATGTNAEVAESFGTSSLEDAYLELVGRKEISRAHVEADEE